MKGPLSGVRVVDVTSMISGPIATRMLADQGADVIKVESPRGDLTRSLGGRKRGMAPIFALSNRNKRSLVLDLKDARGIDVLKRLCRGADVFVQNFRPGTAERMGIDAETLRAENPRLVYVSISGFGERGPYAHKRVYDPVVQAVSGLASIQGAGGRPRMMRVIIPDKLTSVTAAQAISAALFARERSGDGAHVRLSMLDTVVAFHWPEAMAQHTFVGPDIGGERPADARDLVFETADGFITVGTVQDVEWEAFARAVDRPHLLEDARFATAAGRVKHADARLELMADILRTRPATEWLSRLDAAEVPCAPILTREDLLTDPQLAENELILESTHPTAGPMRQPRPAARFATDPWQEHLPAPTLGQHTDEILTDLGLTDTDRTTLRKAGVLG